MSIRVRLLVGAAFPLLFTLPAVAQVQITTATTTPATTATANNGAPADVEITSDGSITLSAAANSTAVTIDSNNSLTNDGVISVPDSDNSVGIRILPNLSANYTGAGSITLLEDYAREDSDDDDDEDGPLAIGTGRTGILVEPGGTMTGNITLTGGSISVEGNNSYGVSVQSALNGSYSQRGSIGVTGANSIGLDLREDISGDVVIGSGVSIIGEGSIGARVLGDVGGEFSVDGSILATGFTSTSISNYADPDELDSDDTPIADRRDADDLLIGGSGLEVRGDLTRGFLVNGGAVGGADPTEDADGEDSAKDVVQDFNENRSTGSVLSYGSAPAVLIQPLDGAAGDELRLGLVRESVRDTLDDDDDDDLAEIIGVFNYDYGFINRGSITSSGFNIGIPANGLTIAGSADGAHQTIVDGGIFNGGTVSAAAFEANAVGFILGAGASSPQLVNTGSMSASVYTETDHDATAVRIDAGASLPTVTNNGYIGSIVRGYDGDAIAFQDLSGTVTTFVNSSRIVAGYTDDDTDDDITSGLGRAIALDLSNSSSGITLTQNDTPDNARIFGDVLFGVGDDRFDLLSGLVAGDIDFGAAGVETFNINSAEMYGDAIFRGSIANVSLNAAGMEGALSLGAGDGSLSFANGSFYEGGITSTGAVSMVVNNSTMNNTAEGTLNLASMSLTNNARVGFVIDNARVAGNVPIFNVAGVADIAANTVFTPVLEEFQNQAFTLRVLNASTLNLGGPVEQMLDVESPYLFEIGLTQPAGTNGLDLSFRVKDAAELGLNTRQADAYSAVLDLMEQDATVGSAIASIPTANEFRRSWADLMPAPDAGVLRILASNATAAFGATAQRLDLITEKPDAPGGAWTEEFGVYHEADSSTDSLALSGGGFGVAAGLDLLSSGTALIGAFGSLESLELEERNRTRAPLNVSQTAIGAYGGWKIGNLALNGAGAVGFLNFLSDRTVEAESISERLQAKWDGVSYNAGVRAIYTLPLGFLDLKPFVAADYITLKQDGFRETALTEEDPVGGLALIASDSESSLATGSYGVMLAGNFGTDDALRFRPQLSVGYRNVLAWDPASPEYQFAGNTAGTTFSLTPGVDPEDAIVAGFGLRIDSPFLNIKLGYDTEIGDAATTHYGSITLRMAFW